MSLPNYIDSMEPPNQCMNLTVQPVTVPACARPAPDCPAGYAYVSHENMEKCKCDIMHGDRWTHEMIPSSGRTSRPMDTANWQGKSSAASTKDGRHEIY